MEKTIAMLSKAAVFVGGLIVVFGGMWLMLNLNQQERIKGPVLMMITGALIAGLGPQFAAKV